MSKILNESIKRHIEDIDNCHCSYRTFDSESSATARCNKSNIVKAYINWQQFNDHYKVNLRLPLGLKFKDKIYITDTDEDVDAKITALFVLMDDAWNN